MSAETITIGLGFVLCCLLIFGPLVAIALLSEARSLRTAGIPYPWLIIRRKIRALLPVLPGSNVHTPLDGRLAWLTWDLHWGPYGSTIARVIGTLPSESALTLALEHPIEVTSTARDLVVRLEQVQFYPRKPRIARYDLVAVPGTLLPEVDSGYRCTANLIIYPDGA